MQKERLRAEEMFVLDDTGAVVEAPAPPAAAAPGEPCRAPLKLSECAPLFMSVRAASPARQHPHADALTPRANPLSLPL